MKKLLFAFCLLIVLSFVLHDKKSAAYIPPGKKITVYTTAENTGYRLSLTETLQSSPAGQPLETEPTVFVDPSKTFQSYLGIGGALTDASAETFYKLPKDKQK
jgi:glucosylceramidase